MCVHVHMYVYMSKKARRGCQELALPKQRGQRHQGKGKALCYKQQCWAGSPPCCCPQKRQASLPLEDQLSPL